MLLPGQVEKWLIIINVSKYAIKDLPLKMFAETQKELETNYIDYNES